MSRINFLEFILSLAIIQCAKSQRVKYLNGLEENESCELNPGIYGTCQKISDCKEEFVKYRKKQTVLKVCSYEGVARNHLICCPTNHEKFSKLTELPQIGELKIQQQSNKQSSLLDYETCRDEFLKYRENVIEPKYFNEAIKSKKIPLNDETCNQLETLNTRRLKSFLLGCISTCTKKNGTLHTDRGCGAWYGVEVNLGDRPNMAAIGWTQPNREIVYNCGGSIITDKFIVTAAHCKFHLKKQADTVRVGDRYLLTQKDDEYAQQLKIQEFIVHPSYTSDLKYNDIALIKTTRKIIFSKYIVPSCIGNMNTERIGSFTKWSVAGYGETEKEQGKPSNVLLELNVYEVPNEECNKTYSYSPDLPNGIIESQFCVNSRKRGEGEFPDTCFGDSGSPLQFKTNHEIFHDDFNTSYLSTVYQTSVVLGIVSFGISCGLNVSSVYTKLDFYRDWMKSVIERD